MRIKTLRRIIKAKKLLFKHAIPLMVLSLVMGFPYDDTIPRISCVMVISSLIIIAVVKI